uniref:Phlebovirus_G2 domain-containing protein n=1 Tax=Steinernema glaseri TaxID=37863 RepID=A0A1I8AWA4_9BILA
MPANATFVINGCPMKAACRDPLEVVNSESECICGDCECVMWNLEILNSTRSWLVRKMWIDEGRSRTDVNLDDMTICYRTIINECTGICSAISPVIVFSNTHPLTHLLLPRCHRTSRNVNSRQWTLYCKNKPPLNRVLLFYVRDSNEEPPV